MITWDEIKPAIRAVLRGWWIILLSVGVASGTAYYVSRGETRYYVARASLMVGNTISMQQPDQYQLSIGSSLARFYAELARRSRILDPVQQSLQLPFSADVVSQYMLQTNVVPNANLLEISITDSNPQRAAAIANRIGEQLVSYSPTAPEKIAAEQQAVGQQLSDSQQRINQIKAKIDDLTERQKAATSASDLAEINQTLIELSTSLEREQSTYSTLLSYKNSSETNSLSFFEHAAPPAEPLPSKRLIIIGIVGIAGFLLALIAIFCLDRMDKRWRGARDVNDRLRMGNLGSVPNGPPMLDAPAAYVRERLPAVSEAQTNIMLASSGVRTLLLSSPSPSESRTALSVDLADLFGRSGQRVLIVDADFAASFLTRMLAAPSAPHTWTVMSDDARGELWMDFRETPLSNVALLPSYSRANGTPALISSLRWRELVQRLLGTADVIIFDGPAALRGPDAALLAPHVDGVVLVLDPQTDSLEAVENSKARLSRQNGTNLLGAVTFRPSDHEQRRGSLWRRLRGPRLAALPPGPVASAAEDAALPREPIITPPPARAENPAMPRGPIITPAPADDDSANAPPVVPADPGEAAVAAAPARSLAGPEVEPGAGDSAQAEAAPARRAGAPRRSAARTTKPRAPRSTNGERKQQ